MAGVIRTFMNLAALIITISLLCTMLIMVNLHRRLEPHDYGGAVEWTRPDRGQDGGESFNWTEVHVERKQGDDDDIVVPVYEDGGGTVRQRKRKAHNLPKHSKIMKQNWPKLRRLQKKYLVPENRPPDSAYNLNVTLSDVISLDRKVIESRPKECRDITYDTNLLPTASVIIPFHNEALSMLLRTVHSVLNNAPDDLLADVILVDDSSVYSYLKVDLPKYVNLLPKVKLLRTEERVGLIKARLLGADHATGDVIIFQDAHTECNTGWLEPLLAEIQRNPRAVVQPHIDQIDAKTIEYLDNMKVFPLGAFGWDLRFAWTAVPEHEQRRVKSKPTRALRSPALVGCALAADKNNFLRTGAFDTDLKIWGGENMELSFRTWMCGGEVLTVPCSRVGHVFKVQTYGFLGEKAKVVKRNSIRVAEVWMDDYKRFFYAATSGTKVALEDAGKDTILERRNLREKLKCKSFQWYLDNIVPDLQKPTDDVTLYGDVSNTFSNVCLKVDHKTNHLVLSLECYIFRITPKLEFSLDAKGRFRFRGKCIDFGDNLLLQIHDCHSVRKRDWSLQLTGEGKKVGKVVAQSVSGGEGVKYCLTHVTNIIEPYKNEQMPQMNVCKEDSKFQTWEFKYFMAQDVLKSLKVVKRR